MKTKDKLLKIDLLNTLIKKILETELNVNPVEMILLSARATFYLRNNDLRKYKNIEPAIDDILNIYKKKDDNIKLSA